jgi:hypothetical protein
MDVCSRATGEAFKKVRDKFGLQIANEAGAHLGVDSKGSATAKVNGGDSEGFVHGHDEVAGAEDSTLVAESAIEGFAECDANVFDGVMLIDIKITITIELEIKGAVAREEFQHVIEEANAGYDLVLAIAFNSQIDRNAGFGSVARKARNAVCTAGDLG